MEAIEEVKRNTYGSVPGMYEIYKDKENNKGNPIIKASIDLLDPPPKLAWKTLSLGEKMAAQKFME